MLLYKVFNKQNGWISKACGPKLLLGQPYSNLMT